MEHLFVHSDTVGQNYIMKKKNPINSEESHSEKYSIQFQIPGADPKSDHLMTLLGIVFQLGSLSVLIQSKGTNLDYLPGLLQEIKFKLTKQVRVIRHYDWISDDKSQ